MQRPKPGKEPSNRNVSLSWVLLSRTRHGVTSTAGMTRLSFAHESRLDQRGQRVQRLFPLTGGAGRPWRARDDAPAPGRAGPHRMRQLNLGLETLQARDREGAFITRRDRSHALDGRTYTTAAQRSDGRPPELRRDRATITFHGGPRPPRSGDIANADRNREMVQHHQGLRIHRCGGRLERTRSFTSP